MPLLGKALVAALGLAAVGRAGLTITILADTNRDGVTNKDDLEARKGVRHPDMGALMLANIGATMEACAKDENCNDASGDNVFDEKYLAHVKTLPLNEPSDEIEDSMTGRILNSGPSPEKVRIFYKAADGQWVFMTKDHQFPAAELRKGLELGVDSRDVRRPNWNGQAILRFQVLKESRVLAEDRVTLVVAPVLTHHALQKPEQVYTVGALEGYGDQKHFNDELDRFSAMAGLSNPVYRFPASNKIWAQDFFETGYTSIPGEHGPVSLRVMIRSSQILRKGDQGKLVFTELRKPGVGAVLHQPTRQGDRVDGGGLDSLGNLETIPPHTNPKTGHKYPAGRPIMGVDPDEANRKPYILEFLREQSKAQGQGTTPLEVDSGWLLQGHVDEFLQFLPDPMKTRPGRFLLAHSSPRAALKVFSDVQKEHGQEKIYSRKSQEYDRPIELDESEKKRFQLTIDDVLNDQDLVALNKACADRIERVIAQIKEETGLTDADIIKVPVLYRSEKQMYPRSLPVEEEGKFGRRGLGVTSEAEERTRQLERRREGDLKAASLFPASPNGLVLGDDFLLLPDTFGPVIKGKDILQTAVEEAYGAAGFKNIHKMDDFFDHHLQMGDIHCGTNMARDASQKWW